MYVSVRECTRINTHAYTIFESPATAFKIGPSPRNIKCISFVCTCIVYTHTYIYIYIYMYMNTIKIEPPTPVTPFDYNNNSYDVHIII